MNHGPTRPAHLGADICTRTHGVEGCAGPGGAGRKRGWRSRSEGPNAGNYEEWRRKVQRAARRVEAGRRPPPRAAPTTFPLINPPPALPRRGGGAARKHEFQLTEEEAEAGTVADDGVATLERERGKRAFLQHCQTTAAKFQLRHSR